RYGKTIEQQVALSMLETPDGKLVEFRTEVTFGPTPVEFVGRVNGQVLAIETSTQGARQTSTIPWSAEIRGVRGAEQSLAAQPFSPHQKRSLRMLVPLVNQVADVEMAAADYEKTRLLNEDVLLLRVETSAKLPDGNVMAETLWCDAKGNVLKRRIAGI